MIVQKICDECKREFNDVVLSFGSPTKRPILQRRAQCQKCRQKHRRVGDESRRNTQGSR